MKSKRRLINPVKKFSDSSYSHEVKKKKKELVHIHDLHTNGKLTSESVAEGWTTDNNFIGLPTRMFDKRSAIDGTVIAYLPASKNDGYCPLWLVYNKNGTTFTTDDDIYDPDTISHSILNKLLNCRSQDIEYIERVKNLELRSMNRFINNDMITYGHGYSYKCRDFVNESFFMSSGRMIVVKKSQLVPLHDSDIDYGCGVFTDSQTTIKQGEIIGLYSGKWYRRSKNGKSKDVEGSYKFEVPLSLRVKSTCKSCWIVDATELPRNIIGMVNDSNGTTSDNNCTFRVNYTNVYGNPPHPSIELVADKTLRPNTELLANYGPFYFSTKMPSIEMLQ